MGAPFSTNLSDYTKAFTLTWGASWEKLVWLILEQSPLLYLMYKKGAIHLEAAPHARIPFAHAENPNVQTYQGAPVGQLGADFLPVSRRMRQGRSQPEREAPDWQASRG